MIYLYGMKEPNTSKIEHQYVLKCSQTVMQETNFADGKT